MCLLRLLGLQSNLSGDLGTVINMGALALNQVVESAQIKGVDLVLETAQLENQSLVDAVDRMSLDAVPRNARRATGLVPLSSFPRPAF